MSRKTTIVIELTPEERSELERRARSLAEPHRTVVRAKLVLMLADGKGFTAAADAVGLQRRIVYKWAGRFLRKRVDGLEDKPRSGRPPRFSPGGCDAAGQGRL
jgi:hypothetical protein